MNRTELKQLLVAADRQALCDAMSPLDEPARAKLFPDALQLLRIIEGGSFLEEYDTDPIGLENETWFDADFLVELRQTSYPDWRCPRWTASLMMLALADEEFFRNPYQYDAKWTESDLRGMPQRVLEVLRSRRPKWLSGFVKRALKQESTFIAWSVEYGLIDAGVLPENDSEDFYKRMANYPLMTEHYASDAVKHDNLPPRFKSLAEALRSDPELLETHFWKLFKYDCGAFNYSHSPWFEAIKTLSDAGDIDRDRLLAVSVESMSRPFRPKELAGYGKLHEHLEPLIEEREVLVEQYFAALNSEQSTVVGMGLTALEKLAKVKKLRALDFLNHCQGALQIAQKSPPIKTIKLIRTLIKQQPESKASATEVLAIAVCHERPDVQEAAVKELDSLRDHLTDVTRERLIGAQGLVASVLRDRLASLIASSVEPANLVAAKSSSKSNTKAPSPKAAKSAKTPPLKPATVSDDCALAELKTRLDKLPTAIAGTAHVAMAIEQLETGDDVPPLVSQVRPADVPRRDPQNAIQPIESLEELIDTVATVIERVDDAMDIERILDGVSRFGMERPDDFDKRVSPLRKRIKKLDVLYSRNVIDLGASIGFSQLLADWLEMEPIRREHDSWRGLDGLLFRKRCEEVNGSLSTKGNPLPRLALPTHRGGWLGPQVLVERLRIDYLEHRNITGEVDLAQALLRLTPDGRAAALKSIKDLKQQPGGRLVSDLYSGGRQLEYALGDNPTFRPSNADVWVRIADMAAMHSRAFIEDPNFKTEFPVARVYRDQDSMIHVDGPFVDDPSVPVRLCVHAHSVHNTGDPDLRETEWIHQLESMAWPANPEPMFMLGCLDGVFDPDLTWTPEATRLVVFASSADSKEQRLQATDALIESVSQVRVAPRLIGEQMSQLREHLTLKRTSEVLASVAQVSDLHQWNVFHAIDAFVGRLRAAPKDLHFALTPMLEAAFQSGCELSEPAAVVLRSIKGGSKTGKLAKQLLAVEQDSRKQFAVRLQSVAAAIERFERWARAMGS